MPKTNAAIPTIFRGFDGRPIVSTKRCVSKSSGRTEGYKIRARQKYRNAKLPIPNCRANCRNGSVPVIVAKGRSKIDKDIRRYE